MSTTNEPITVFRTKNLDQAAFLWCQPDVELQKLQGVSKFQGVTVFFFLTVKMSEQALRTLMLDYANGKTTVEPNQFCAKQNSLRDLLRSTFTEKKG